MSEVSASFKEYFLLQKICLKNYDSMFKIIVFSLLSVLHFSPLFSEEVNLKISLKNGTTGGIGKADTIKLIALQGGMVPIGEFTDKQGSFTLDKVNMPDDAPVLIQVNYKGANYNKMVPPTPVFRSKVQEITVFEITPEFKNIEVKGLIQILREENSLRIYKIFLIDNKTNPPRSFHNTENPIEVFIPPSASEVFGQLKQGDSKMGIPLTLQDGKNGKALDRPILPGASELQISYIIPAPSLGDVTFQDEISIEDKKSPIVVFFKPKDMKVELKGALNSQAINENIPQGLGAVRANYPENGKVEISVIGGVPDAAEEMGQGETRKVRNGTIFTTWDKSLLAVIGCLALLFSLSFIFVYKK